MSSIVDNVDCWQAFAGDIALAASSEGGAEAAVQAFETGLAGIIADA